MNKRFSFIQRLIFLSIFFFMSTFCQEKKIVRDFRSAPLEVKKKLIFDGQEYYQKCDYTEYKKTSFALTKPQIEGILADIEIKFKEEFLLPLSSLKLLREPRPLDPKKKNTWSFLLQVKHRETPFCRLSLKSTYFDGDISFAGLADFPSTSTIKRNPLEKLDASIFKKIFPKDKIYRSTPCWYYHKKEDALEKVHEVFYFEDSFPYSVLVRQKEKIKSSKIRHFNLLFKEKNKEEVNKQASLKTIDQRTENVGEMQDSGYLCNKYFSLSVPKTSEIAYSKDLNFSYPSGDMRVLQVTAFAHINKMYAWYQKRGAKNWSKSQVEILFTSDRKARQVGPVYKNPQFTKFDRPSIVLPDFLEKKDTKGNLRKLTLLQASFDLLAHELGHHILFEYVGYAKGQTVVHNSIVEAIPDIFVMIYNKSPCLAQKTCSLRGSNFCLKNCLRTADNTMHYPDEINYSMYCKGGVNKGKTIKADYHICSKFMTGIFWDLGKLLGLDILGHLIFQSLSFLPYQNLDYKKVYDALLKADQKYFKKQLSAKIKEAFQGRGLDYKT